MNYLNKKISARLLIAVAIAVSSSLSAFSDTFKDSTSGLYFATSDDGTCSVVKPTSGKYSGDIVIPSTVMYNDTEYTVTSIGDKAFQTCTSLTSVTIPESVTSIGSMVFYNCSALTKVNISNLEAWCKLSFNLYYSNPLYYAHHLYLNGELVTELDIPDSVTEIKEYAFENGSFTSLTLPSTITSIGISAFSDCTALKYLTLGDGLTSIGTSAFSGCTSLLGEVSDKFNNTGESGTKKVLIIPNSVTTISTSAFQNCTALENLWLGASVKNIGESAFAGDDLTSVTSTAAEAPELAAKNVFSDATYAEADLYIAKTADLDSYKSSGSYWAEFESIDSENVLTGVDEVSTDMTIAINGNAIDVAGYEGEISIYNMSGMRVYQGSSNKIEMDNPGIYVIVISGKCYKIAIK